MKKYAAFATGLILLMVMGAFAQTTTRTHTSAKKAPAAKVQQAKGTIVSADASSLVITHKVSGKDEQMTFALDAQSKKTGDLVKDAIATVHYTVEGGANKVTSVTATAPKAMAKAAPKKVGK